MITKQCEVEIVSLDVLVHIAFENKGNQTFKWEEKETKMYYFQC